MVHGGEGARAGKGGSAVPPVYRARWRAVKAATLAGLLLLPALAAAQGDLGERLEAARSVEARIARLEAHLAAGRVDSLAAGVARPPVGEDADPRLLRLAGTAALLQGHPDEAIPWLERALRRDPSLAPAHLDLGRALLATGVRGRAVAELRRAVELDPASVDAHLALGRTLLGLRRADQARASLERAHELAPRDPRVLRSRAEMLLAEGPVDRALAAWRAEEERAPDVHTARALGELLREANPAAARAHFEACAGRDSTAADCFAQAGTLALAQGDAAAAATSLAAALRAGASEGAVVDNLYVALERRGGPAALREALALRDRHPPAGEPGWGSLVLLLRAGGDGPGALAAVVEALELHPASASLHNLHGVLLAEAGRPGAAREAFGRALELEPGHEGALGNLRSLRGGP